MTLAINNGTECYVPWSALTTSGAAYTPTSVSYQVWDTTNGIQVVPPTSVTAASTGTITLSATVNTMSALSSGIEAREVTVKLGIPGGSYENLTTAYTLLRKPGTP